MILLLFSSFGPWPWDFLLHWYSVLQDNSRCQCNQVKCWSLYKLDWTELKWTSNWWQLPGTYTRKFTEFSVPDGDTVVHKHSSLKEHYYYMWLHTCKVIPIFITQGASKTISTLHGLSKSNALQRKLIRERDGMVFELPRNSMCFVKFSGLK